MTVPEVTLNWRPLLLHCDPNGPTIERIGQVDAASRNVSGSACLFATDEVWGFRAFHVTRELPV